jgi:tetratricopeptide (TPR) repeat protein
MKSRLRFLSVVLLFLCFFLLHSQLHAQWQSPSVGVPQSSPDATETQTVVLSGKVAVEGSGDISFDTEVLLVCGSQERARTGTDSKGNFTIQINVPSDSQPQTSQAAIRQDSVSWNNCELYAESSGFRSEKVSLNAEPLNGIVRVGTITLHPVVQAQNAAEGTFTVSATSLAAPDSAKKAFAKGQEQARKGKWAEAVNYFRRAVQVYPRFALAWLELGKAQIHQNDFAEAQQSFQQAATHDNDFMPAYVELTKVAVQQQNWKSLAYATDRIVQLSPQASAQFWFLNAAAHFNLGNIAGAENSAERGLRLDSKHQVPQLEYLYGVILAGQQKYPDAITHIKAYLQMSPRAADAQQAQQKLALIEKMAAVPPSASATTR